ncbi:T9SS type A sorting domain-containing protein [Puteibacter caeruleilacunae]|nr:T9SS type A sorting domain-containing protein [Puteibacter caeruleilacunae]
MKRPLLCFYIIGLLLISFQETYGQAMPSNIKGQAVATCFSGYIGNNAVNGIEDDYVVGVIDVHNPVGPGTNWPAPMYHGPGNTWKSSRMGQIFGIAIDKRNNIYVTSTIVYNNPQPSTYAFGPAGPGGIYKLDGVTGMVSDFITSVAHSTTIIPGTSTALPNGDGINRGPGLGNICYNHIHDKLYVTNFEDGKIYRIDPILGVIDGIYDPIAPANPGSTTNPAMAADSGTYGIAPRGERVWGITYNGLENRIYYGVWVEDLANNSASTKNIIRSIELDATGQFVPGTDVFELELPDFTDINGNTFNYSMPISDLTFNSDRDKILIGERGASNSFYAAHKARVLEYTGSSTSWGSMKQIHIGNLFTTLRSTNCAGGIDYAYRSYDNDLNLNLECDSTIWSTGDGLVSAPGFGGIYGIQRSPASGNTSATISTTGYFIDLDGNPGSWDKNQIGDIEVYRDSCGMATQTDPDPCDKISVTAKPQTMTDTDCCYELTLSNGMANYISSVSAQVLTPSVTISGVTGPSGWGVTNTGSMATWTPPSFLPTGNTTGLILCLYSLVPPPQQVEITFHAVDGTVCIDTLEFDCPEMPPPVPPCFDLQEQEVNCVQSTSSGNIYDFMFSFTNNSPFSTAPYSLPAENILVYPITSGITITPANINFPPVGYGATSGPHSFTISGTGALADSTICFVMQLHGAMTAHDYEWCCPPDTICITLPDCKDCCENFEFEIIQEKLTHNGAGTTNLQSLVTAGPQPIIAASATIVSAARKINCGQNQQWMAVSGTISNPPDPWNGLPLDNPLSNIPGAPPVNSFADVHWGIIPGGVSTSGVSLNLDLDFPAPPWPFGGCTDSLKFCIRYSFTDTLCHTCDTVICYEQVRKGKIIIFDPFPHDPIKLVKIKMTDSGTGQLMVDIPQREDGDEDTYRITGIILKPQYGVHIESLSGSGTSAEIIEQMEARLPVNISQGQSQTYDLKFNNYAGLSVFTNEVILRYEYLSMKGQTFESSATINARVPDATGSMDIMANDRDTEKVGVYTFQVYFANMNFTEDNIKRLRIMPEDGVSILAIGPTENSGEVTMQSYKSSDGRMLLQPLLSGGAAEASIEASQEVKPIYLTVSGVSNESFSLAFQSINEAGDVVTEGEFDVTDPMVTSADDLKKAELNGFTLNQNYPNPVSNFTTIQFSSDHHISKASLTVRDVSGRIVSRIFENRDITIGDHAVVYDASKLPSGTYVYTISTGNFTTSKKMSINK